MGIGRTIPKVARDTMWKRVLEMSNHRLEPSKYVTMRPPKLDEYRVRVDRLFAHVKYHLTRGNMIDTMKLALEEWKVISAANEWMMDAIIPVIENSDGTIPRVLYFESYKGYQQQVIINPIISGMTRRRGQIILFVSPEKIIEWGGDPVLSNRNGKFTRATYIQKGETIYNITAGMTMVTPTALVHSSDKTYMQLAAAAEMFREIIENNYVGVKEVFVASRDALASLDQAVALLRIRGLLMSCMVNSMTYIAMQHNMLGRERAVVIGQEDVVDLGDGYLLRSGLPQTHKAAILRMDRLASGGDKYVNHFAIPKLTTMLTSCLTESYVDKVARMQSDPSQLMRPTKYEVENGYRSK